MIPKSGYRFPEKIMRQQNVGRAQLLQSTQAVP
jgi:hypothetical protein